MLSLIKSDFRRLVKQKSFYVCLILLFVFNGFIMLLFSVLKSIPGMGMTDPSGLSTLKIFAAPATLLFTSPTFLGLFLIIAVSILTGNDFSGNTIRNKLLCGKSRNTVFFATFFMQLIVAGIYLFAILIFNILISLLVFTGYINFGNVLIHILMIMLCYISFIGVSTFISVSSRSKAIGIALNIIIMVALYTILNLFIVILGAFSADIAEGLVKVINLLPYVQVSSLSAATYYTPYEIFNVATGDMVGMIITPIVLLALSLVGGALIFNRADIK